MIDDLTDDADADCFMQPLYRLIFEVFELTGIFKWLPRTLVSLVQVTYGKSISRYHSASVFLSVSESVFKYLLVYLALTCSHIQAGTCVGLFAFLFSSSVPSPCLV